MERRPGIVIMGKLIGLLKGLIPIMVVAIVLGTLGYLCAISITIFGAQIIASQFDGSGLLLQFSADVLIIMMIVAAISRGILHYAEQYCNHFIAFKLLAVVRKKVFHALRALCPAKLDGKDKGNLISVITTDIELLEVFYAHTISPIFIAMLTSLIMVAFFWQYSAYAAVLAIIAYAVVGVAVPLINGSFGKNIGSEYREKFGDMNSFTLETLRGIDDVIQYDYASRKIDELNSKTEDMEHSHKKLSSFEGVQRSITNAVIIIFTAFMLGLCAFLNQTGEMGVNAAIVCVVAMMGSFGPVVAIASLSNNLNQTLASGERVLRILEEEPLINEVTGAEPLRKSEGEVAAELEDVDFSYDERKILSHLSLAFKRGKMTGILGKSGCGKSTILKLLMRFYNPQAGVVNIEERDVRSVNAEDLRHSISYVTQETQLFNDTIAANIAVGKQNATKQEVENAAKAASIHNFITTLPEGYDTNVGELGDTLSGGEKQRIGVARAFLHDADIMLLDEPTSNLDALNEGIILESLNKSASNKTVVFVSHRPSTLSSADDLIQLGRGMGHFCGI